MLDMDWVAIPSTDFLPYTTYRKKYIWFSGVEHEGKNGQLCGV